MNEPMMSFAGWVGTDVTLSVTPSGVPVAKFRVGTNPRVQRDGVWADGEPVWHTVKVWRALAENVAASLRQGDPVFVSGRLTAETWVRDDNTRSTRHVVVASVVGHDLSKGTAEFTKNARRNANLVVEPTGADAGEERPQEPEAAVA